MKIEKCPNTYLEAYDVYVEHYLTYEQIQNIANEVKKFTTWAERKIIKDYMILCYATNLTQEQIDGIDKNIFLNSGLIEEIESEIYNIYQIEEAIEYEESIAKQLNQLIKDLPNVAKEAVSKGLKKENK